jgi:hypothetical protein
MRGSRTHSSLLLLVALSWACFRIFLETLHHHRQRKHDEKIEQLRLLPRRIGKSDSNKRGQLLVPDRRGIGKQGEQPTLTTEHKEKKEAPFSSLKQQLSAATAHDKFKPKTPANCCHDQNRLINDFLMEGMGMAPTHTFRCLQDLVDPVLRVCCADDMRCIQSKTVGIADSKS